MLPVVDRLRGLTGPTRFDVQMTQLTIQRRNWSGGRVGRGSAQVQSELVLPRKYRIREIRSAEIASSGGRYEAGDVRVRVTPASDEGTGYTAEQLAPTGLQEGQETRYILTGGIEGDYARIELKTDRAFSYELVLRRTSRRVS